VTRMIFIAAALALDRSDLITLSARVKDAYRIVRSSALAVLRLMKISDLVGRSTASPPTSHT
jgi:hypothetical protein